MLLGVVVVALFAFFAGTASADMAAAKKWVENEFQPSTLSKADQLLYKMEDIFDEIEREVGKI